MPIKLDVSVQAVDDLHQVSGIARQAADAGFAGLWSSEVNHDPFIQLALAATQSGAMELGTAIALSFTRSPMTLAYTSWDLAAMTKGRFILGLGTQVKAHNEKRFSVAWPEPPAPRLREMIEGMRHIWHSWRTGEKLAFRGEYYKFTLMTPFFTPPRHKFSIPIYIAGVNEGLCRLAGKVCDGFHLHPLNSQRYLSEQVRPWIAAGAESEGRSASDCAIAASVFVVTGMDKNQKAFWREFVKQQISFYASTPSYATVFDLHGWTGEREQLSVMAREGKWSEMPRLVTEEMINTFAIVAEPEEVGAAALERYAGLADRVMFYVPYLPGQLEPMWRGALEAFSKQ